MNCSVVPKHQGSFYPTYVYVRVAESSVFISQTTRRHIPKDRGLKPVYRHSPTCRVGQDSSVGMATHYRLDGPGIEFRWLRDFPHPSDRPWGLPSLLYNGYRVFPGGKTGGVWRWPPTPSSAEVKERVDLYLYSPLWAFVNITFILPDPNM